MTKDLKELELHDFEARDRKRWRPPIPEAISRNAGKGQGNDNDSLF